MKTKLFIFLLLDISTLIPSVTWAEPLESNLREACRKHVAGVYLNAQNLLTKEKAYSEHLTQKINDLKESVHTYQKQLDELNQKLDEHAFNLELTYQRDGVASKVQIIKKTIAENETFLKESQPRVQSYENIFLNLEKKMSPVFNIEKNKQDNIEVIHVKYKKTCPKYRVSCPLAKSESAKLLKIFPKGEAPLYCKRYATFLQK